MSFTEINFYIIAEDSAGNTTTALISVSITDENDHSPKFTQPKYFAQIPENPPADLFVAQVVATDQDSGKYGTSGLRFTDLQGQAKQELLLDEMTGEIEVVVPEEENFVSVFDRETISEIYMIVEVKDNNGAGKSSTAVLVIQLTDKNDNKPKFSQKFYETVVYENQEGVSLALNIFATDADQPNTNNSKLQYSIIPHHQGLENHITIDPDTGMLSLTKGFDFEALAKMFPTTIKYGLLHPLIIPINFTLEATDLGVPSQKSSVPLTILVEDTNDCMPKFLRLAYNTSVKEDVKSQKNILNIKAEDQDASSIYSQVRYQIVSGDSLFVLDSNTGVISVRAGYLLDWDVKSKHVFNVSCMDGGNLNCEQDAVVTVNVLDVNNKPPEFVQQNGLGKCSRNSIAELGQTMLPVNFIASVPENTIANKEIMKVVATDLDYSAELRYHLDYFSGKTKCFKDGHVVTDYCQGDFSEYIKIDSHSGVIVTGSQAFDYETVDQAIVDLGVDDDAAEVYKPQQAFATLILKIENVLDLKPIFVKPFYDAKVKENVPIGSLVITVEAVVDEKMERIPDLIYNIDEEGIPFEIDSLRGHIRVKGQIDREEKESYMFEVKAQYTKALWSTVRVMITVEDENDNVVRHWLKQFSKNQFVN